MPEVSEAKTFILSITRDSKPKPKTELYMVYEDVASSVLTYVMSQVQSQLAAYFPFKNTRDTAFAIKQDTILDLALKEVQPGDPLIEKVKWF